MAGYSPITLTNTRFGRRPFEFTVKDLLPRAEVELAGGDGDATGRGSAPTVRKLAIGFAAVFSGPARRRRSRWPTAPATKAPDR